MPFTLFSPVVTLQNCHDITTRILMLPRLLTQITSISTKISPVPFWRHILFLPAPPTSLAPGNHWSVHHFCNSFVSGVFCKWPHAVRNLSGLTFPRSVILCRAIRLTACISSSLPTHLLPSIIILWYERTHLFNQSPVAEHLGGLQFGAMTNKATADVHGQGFVWSLSLQFSGINA